MKKTIALLAATALLTFTASRHAEAAEVGKPAPAFTLTDTQGNSHSLADFKGKIVVLEWINHGCPFVKKFYEPGKMQELQKKYTEKDVVWLAVCSSAEGKQGYHTAEEWNEVNEKNGTAVTALLLDTDGTAGKAYGAKVTPHMYVIDAEGTLVYNGAIDSIKSAKQEDIEKADNYVVEALEAVMAGNPVETATSTPYGCSVKY